MRRVQNAARFFSKEEYKNLRFKHLSFKDYKAFIKEDNERIAQEILEKKEGVMLPCNLGLSKIVKLYKPKGVYAAHMLNKKELNLHTFGYVYLIKHFVPTPKSVKYNKKYNEKTRTRGDTPYVDVNYYKFQFHRENLKRPLKDIIINQVRDYDKL